MSGVIAGVGEVASGGVCARIAEAVPSAIQAANGQTTKKDLQFMNLPQ
jgi:hypothetical protein